MRKWFRNPRRFPNKPAIRKPATTIRPSVEQLEDRTVLQSGLSPNQAFVTAAYQVFLNRAPDAGGFAAWTSALDSGALNTNQVAVDFVNSAEFRANSVQNLYQTLLHRQADQGGLNAFVGYLQQGGTINIAESIILGSEEYFQTQGGGTNTGFVTALYRDVLNRTPDASGLQNWLTALSNGVSRQQVALSFLYSQEGINRDVQHLYNRFLSRNPDPGGQAAFTAALQANESAANVFPNDPPGDPSSNTSSNTGSASSSRNTGTTSDTTGSASSSRTTDTSNTGSASQARNVQINTGAGASLTLPAGTTVNSAVNVPAGATAISVPGLTLPAGIFAVLLPGQTLPSGATVLSDVTVPTGAETVTIPGVSLPAGTVAVPALGVSVNGTIVGVSGNNNGDGSASDTRNVNTSAGADLILPAGTAVTTGITLAAGATAISVPGLNLPSGAVLALLPGQTLPTGATVLSGVTLPAGAETLTIPGVTLPSGTVAVPILGASLNGQSVGLTGSTTDDNNTSGSASQQRNLNTDPPAGMSHEQVIAALVSSPEFASRANG